MTRTVDAIFTNGALRPLEALPLREQERVRVTVESIDNNGVGGDGARRRLIDGFDKLRLRTGGRLPSRDELHERR